MPCLRHRLERQWHPHRAPERGRNLANSRSYRRVVPRFERTNKLEKLIQKQETGVLSRRQIKQKIRASERVKIKVIAEYGELDLVENVNLFVNRIHSAHFCDK